MAPGGAARRKSAGEDQATSRVDGPSSSAPRWKAPLVAVAVALCVHRALDYHSYWNSLSPVVLVEQGALQGRAAVTASGTPYFAFQGVPFAAPPVGRLRFADPQPPASWGAGEVRDARADGPVCSQGPMMLFPAALPSNVSAMDVVRFLGSVPALVHRAVKVLRHSEDCLYLNVFTPRVPQAGDALPLLPVLVFVHGGGFFLGDGGLDMLGPQHLVERGVVLVTIQYRLGPLGFLALDGAPEGIGNAALKDVVAALRWVRANVARFGGDPGAVTISGQSAGAAIAHYMTFIPAAEGLFHRLILMTGSALHSCGFSTPAKALARTREMVRRLLRPEAAGGPGPDAPAAPDEDDPEDVLRFLREVDVRLLLDFDNFGDTAEENKWLPDELPFQPTVDGTLLPAAPLDLIRSGRFHHVPTMIGLNAREGLFAFPSSVFKRRSIQEQADLVAKDFHYALPEYMRDLYPRGSEDLSRLEAFVKDHFFGEPDIGKASLQKFVDFYGEVMFVIDSDRTMKELVAVSTAPIYAYNFTFEGRNNLLRRTMLFHVPEFKGATHCDELAYLFHIDILPHIPFEESDPEVQVRKNLLSLFTNFIKSGNPTPAITPETPILWPPVSRKDTPVLNINVLNTVQKDGFVPMYTKFRSTFLKNIFQE